MDSARVPSQAPTPHSWPDAMTTPHVYWHKSVRDLHWVMHAPHLLTPAAGVPVVADAWCADLCARAGEWLRALDAQPAPLETWLRSQRNVRRLGFYFAALLEFWVRMCPVLSSAEGAGRLVLTQQQVHAGIDGQCAGQLKLVFERTDATGASSVLAHWESHVKFFAWCPDEDNGTVAATSTASATSATTSGVAAADAAGTELVCACSQRTDLVHPMPLDAHDECLSTYVGPFLGENLLHRVVELRRKLSLSDAPAVRSFLAAHFGRRVAEHDTSSTRVLDGAACTPPPARTAISAPADVALRPVEVRSESVVRGYLFYPLLTENGGTPAATWDVATVNGTAPPAAAAPPSGSLPVSANHCRGWWTRSLDALLEMSEPASMWALPGNGAGVREDIDRALGGKLHWLGPAMAVCEAADDGVPTSPKKIRGIASLGVEDCPLLTTSELRESLASLYSDDGKTWRANDEGDIPSPFLLQQLLPAPGITVAGEGGGGEGMASKTVVWLEASRGFLMPPDWDPSPLRCVMPLGLRSGMRQKQKSGGACRSDYRNSEQAFAVAPGMLAVRCGADGGFGPHADADESMLDACTAEAENGWRRRVQIRERDGSAADGIGDDVAIADAVVVDVNAAWRKLAQFYHEELKELSLAVLEACTVCGQVLDEPSDAEQPGATGDGLLVRFDAAVRSLFSSTAGAPSASNGDAGAKDDAKDKGSRDKGSRAKGGAANSRFALAKTAIARSVARSRRVRESVNCW